QLTEPFLLVVGYEPPAPGERLRPRSGHSCLYQRVEHLPLAHAETGHHGDAQRGEHRRLIPAPGSPGNRPAQGRLRLPGDGDPGLAGLLPPRLDPGAIGRRPILVVASLGERGLGEASDHLDLLAVDPDLRGLDEPVVRYPPDHPGGDLRVVHPAPPVSAIT